MAFSHLSRTWPGGKEAAEAEVGVVEEDRLPCAGDRAAAVEKAGTGLAAAASVKAAVVGLAAEVLHAAALEGAVADAEGVVDEAMVTASRRTRRR